MNLETAIDRFLFHNTHMRAALDAFKHTHLFAYSATYPAALRSGALAALFVVAGGQPAASSRLARAPLPSTSGHVQLPFLG